MDAHWIGVDQIEGLWRNVPMGELKYALENTRNILLYDVASSTTELLAGFAVESYLEEASDTYPFVHIPVSEHTSTLAGYDREIALRFHYSWINALGDYLFSAEFKKLLLQMKKLREKQTIYPATSSMFRAFLFPLGAIKCVWLGLSPYQSDQACGLAFAVEHGTLPPSLAVLEQGIRDDPGLALPAKFSLDKQLLPLRASGVFLLNSALTTDTADPRNHVELWYPLISRVIQILNYLDISWVCFGKVAATYATAINPDHIIYKLAHPSWYARSGTKMETDVFSKLHVHNGICYN